MWTDQWIGIPYRELGRGPEAYDCLGLFLAVYRDRFGVEIPDPAYSRRDSLRRARVWSRIGDLGRAVDRPQEGDALLFLMGGRSLHIGYALDHKDMLHLETDAARSCVERWRLDRWQTKLEGIYRYAG